MTLFASLLSSFSILIVSSHAFATQIAPVGDVTELMQLAEQGDTAAVRQALKQGAKLEQKTAKGETALWYAVYGGHEDLAIELMSKGANPIGTIKETNECLLHHAAKGQLAKLAAKLKRVTPKCLTQKNSDGQTPSDIAASFGDTKLAKALKP